MGTVPYGLLLPLPRFLSPSPSPSLTLSRVQMHIHLLWSFGLLLFPRYDLPLPDSLPLSRSLPLSVSLYLCFAHPLLPHGPSCLHLNPSSSLSFSSLCVSLFFILLFLVFSLRGEFSDSWGKKKVVLLWVLQHLLNLLHFVERVIHTFSCLVLVLDTSAHSSYPRFNFFSPCARSLNISRTHFFFLFFFFTG